MASIYVYVEATDTNYEVCLSNNGHAAQRLNERIENLNYSIDFILHRVRTWLEDEEASDILTNMVKFGEDVIIEDFTLGFDIVLCHDLDTYEVKTIFGKAGELRKKTGQKVLSFSSFGMSNYLFDNSKRNKKGLCWA